MKLSAAIVIAILTIVQAFGQSSAPGPITSSVSSPLNRSLLGRKPMSSGNMTPSAALHQRIEDMQATLENMHTLIQQMRSRAVKSGTSDPLIKANLDLWGLMISHLDKQLEELKTAETARTDMEVRRAALYKQADAKAEAAAQNARAAMAAKFAGQPAATTPGQTAVVTTTAPNPAAIAPSSPAAAQPPPNSASSPNRQ